MKNSIKIIFCIYVLAIATGCGESPNSSLPLSSAPESLHAAVGIASEQDSEEFRSAEYFDEKRERVKYFIGQFKDLPDPVFNPEEPLKIPNQDDLEILFKYIRKYLDSLELGGPDPEIIKRELFIDENGKLNLNSLLEKFRYRPFFKDVSFSVEGLTFNRAKGVPGIKPVRYTTIFKNLLLKDAEFDSVKLDDIDFSDSELTNVKISNSSFSRILCMRCKFNQVNFVDSTSKDTDFSFSSGDLTFVNSNNSFLKITDSKFDNLTFTGGTLRESVFINGNPITTNNVTTFNNIDESTQAKDTDFKAVGLIYKSSFPGGTAYKILNKIKAADHLPIKVEYGLEKFLDELAIQKEVETLMGEISSKQSEQSIMRNFIATYRNDPQKYPQISKIETMAKGYVNRLNALIIPGGLDVEPFWYDKNIAADRFYLDVRARLKGLKSVEAEKFPIRTLLELFLIEESVKKQIPLLLVCRGAHVYNIYKNGKMIENLPDHFDNVDFEAHLRFVTLAPDLTEEDASHKIVKLFDKDSGKASVYGNHHQAIDKDAAGEGLRILLVWNLPSQNFVPYALYDRTYKPGAWLVQFHPEVKEEMGGAMSRQLSNLNSEIYDSFFELMAPKEMPEPAKSVSDESKPAKIDETPQREEPVPTTKVPDVVPPPRETTMPLKQPPKRILKHRWQDWRQGWTIPWIAGF